MKLGLPSRIGRYEILGHIGSGGMGRVFLGRTSETTTVRRLYAIKVIHEHLLQEEQVITMLLQEAKVASLIHHANVVGIVDTGTEEGHHFLVMEYIEGCTLAQLLRVNLESRPIGVIAAILIDALQGLHAAHTLVDENGRRTDLVHRDVSPDNLLIGMDGIARVTDFGVAKAAGAVSLTAPGIIKGKVAFMSPEQLTGKEIDHRSDIFSAGVVLWNAITGKRLLEGASDHATFFNALKRRVPPPSRAGLRPPEWLDEICLRALHRNPARRYTTAQEMADHLRQAAIAHGELASPSEVAQWVTQAFGSELAQRREQIKDAMATSNATGAPVSLSLQGASGEHQSAVQSFVSEVLSWDELQVGWTEEATVMQPSTSGVAGYSTRRGTAPTTSERDAQRQRSRRALFVGFAFTALSAAASFAIAGHFASPAPQAATVPAASVVAAPSTAPAEPQVAPATTPSREHEPELTVEPVAKPAEQISPEPVAEQESEPEPPKRTRKRTRRASKPAPKRTPAAHEAKAPAPPHEKQKALDTLEDNPYQQVH